MRKFLISSTIALIAPAAMAAPLAPQDMQAMMGTIVAATANEHCPEGTVPLSDVVSAVRVFAHFTGTNALEAGVHLEAIAQRNRDRMTGRELDVFCRSVKESSAF